MTKKDNLNELWINVGKYRTRFIAKGVGQPLILVHGLGSSLETWKHNIDYFSNYFRVYALDMLGFGFADKPRIDYKIDIFVEFLKDFLDALKLYSVNLIGNSLGGLIALLFSLKYESRVNKLILESASGLETEARDIIKSFMGDWWTLSKIKNFYKIVYYRPIIDEKTLESRFELINNPDAKYAYISTLNMPRDWADLPEKLKAFKKQTLIIWGKNDKIIPVKYAYEYHRLIENSKLVIFDETGHVPHAEKPEEFNKVVVDFLIR